PLSFSRRINGGTRSPELVEGNAEPRFSEAGRRYIVEKIPLNSGRALEQRRRLHDQLIPSSLTSNANNAIRC
ncbi:MAG: hypothetical protein JSV55_06255, partial [Deltaproteobacteria bacterium]